jgi:hypothetical protein
LDGSVATGNAGYKNQAYVDRTYPTIEAAGHLAFSAYVILPAGAPGLFPVGTPVKVRVS